MAHLVALCGIAVTQPVLDLLGGSPTFFVAHTAGPGRVLLVCALVVGAVPLVLIGLEALVSAVHRGWGWRLHLLLVGLLGGLIAAQSLDRVPQLPGWLVLSLGGGLGALLAAAYGNGEVARSVLSALAATPLLFAMVFVFGSPAHGLVFPPEVRAAEVQVGGDPPPVFVVVFDELPLASVLRADGGSIDPARFPNLARLAADGMWYPEATSVAGFTHEAVPAILTGVRVHADNVPPTAGGHPRNLFSLLAADYDIRAYEQVTHLCTPQLCERSSASGGDVPVGVLLDDLAVVAGLVSLPSGLDGWLPQVDDSWAFFGRGSGQLDQEADRLGDDRTDFVRALGGMDRVGDFRAAVRQIGSRRRPTLTFVHAVLPHVPWSFHADGSRYADPGSPGLDSSDRWSTGFSADLALQRHLLQAEFADRLLGELLDRLDSTGIYDDSLVVFTADHGASFAMGTNRRVPEATTLPGIMAVPMVVKAPASYRPVSQRHRDDRVAETIDLLPTIADLLGVDVPWPVDGQSLLGPAREGAERSITARGATTRTHARHLDVQPLVDHIHEVFGRGHHLELYGLGPARDLVGRRVPEQTADRSAGACWRPDRQPAGMVGALSGSIETSEDGDVAFAVVNHGRVVGTSLTYDDEDDGAAHRVFALADPGSWGDGRHVQLWRTTGPGAGGPLVRILECR